MGLRAVLRPAFLIAIVVAAVGALFAVLPADARLLLEELPPAGMTVTVQPGDTLAGVADRHGVTLRALMRLNGIQDPRQIYPGQVIVLGDSAIAEGATRVLDPGSSLLEISRATNVDLRTLAIANRLLRPTGLPSGYRVVVPPGDDAVAVSHEEAHGFAPRVVAGLRYGVGWWEIIRLNPVPGTLGLSLLVPPGWAEAIGAGTDDVPSSPLVVTVDVSPQPVSRGETVAFRIVTTQPVTCGLTLLDQVEPCYDVDGTRTAWVGLVGLPALLSVGEVPLAIVLQTDAGEAAEVTLPLVVSAGRYDYERLDLPADRQSLLDPVASQSETARIAALRTLRSPARYWTYPFSLPVQSAVTSYYGSRRSYGYGFGSYHAGTDFDGEIGMVVRTPTPGVVVLADTLVVRGNAVVIDHGWGVVSGYWHLARIDVEVGQEVSVGDQIGLLGNTGLSTGAHLHWELWINGVAVNVLSWLRADGPAALLGAVP